MPEDHITLMTRPIPTATGRWALWLRSVARALWYVARLRPIPKKPEFGGHPAVTRSITAGLNALNLRFNLDPSEPGEVGRNCHVLSDVNALAQAIEWKRKGLINRLTAGPNLVVLPGEHPEVMAAPEIDQCVVNSLWIKELYEADLPALAGRIAIWPAGVDISYWTPDRRERQYPKALIYVKSRNCIELVEQAEELLSQAGFACERILYGNYVRDQFRSALRSSCVAVFFSDHESQGIALAEAWSCDIPTLVWERAPFMVDHTGRATAVRNSSAPYLSEACGMKFSGTADLRVQLEAMLGNLAKFSPREWTVREMSDSATAMVLWDIIQGRPVEVEPVAVS